MNMINWEFDVGNASVQVFLLDCSSFLLFSVVLRYFYVIGLLLDVSYTVLASYVSSFLEMTIEQTIGQLKHFPMTNFVLFFHITQISPVPMFTFGSHLDSIQ